jgi:hypothetical protein
MIPLFGAVFITIYVIIIFKGNAHRARLPQNKVYTEVGQWGPFVVARLVFIATLMAKINGWDFDTKDATTPNHSFKWLLGEDRRDGSGDESLQRLVSEVQGSFIPPPDIVTSPIELGEHHWGARRGSQAPRPNMQYEG